MYNFNENKLSVTMDDGSIIEYEIVASFYLESTNQNYIVYTDGEYVGKYLNIFAIKYQKINNINYVVSDEEWNLIIEKLKDIGFGEINNGKK